MMNSHRQNCNPVDKAQRKRRTIFGVKSDSGFTLMEIMISVVIMGIIASMAAPRLQKEMAKIEFRGGTRAVISTIREARSKAITEKTSYGIAFNANNGTYTLFKDMSGSTDSIISQDTMPGQHSLVIPSFTAPLVFNPDGSASETGFLTLYAFDYDGAGAGTISYATVTILASTGRVKLQESHTY